MVQCIVIHARDTSGTISNILPSHLNVDSTRMRSHLIMNIKEGTQFGTNVIKVTCCCALILRGLNVVLWMYLEGSVQKKSCLMLPLLSSHSILLCHYQKKQCHRARSKPHVNSDIPSDRGRPHTIAVELGWHGEAGWGFQRPHKPLAFSAIVLQTAVGRKHASVGVTALFCKI